MDKVVVIAQFIISTHKSLIMSNTHLVTTDTTSRIIIVDHKCYSYKVIVIYYSIFLFIVNNLTMDSDQEHRPGPSTPKKKRAQRNELAKDEQKRIQIKLFRQEWLEIKDFKYWLQELPNDKTKCKCVACNTVLVCGKSELEKHNLGKKHISNMKGLRGSKNMNLFVQNPMSDEKKKYETDVKRAEIKLSAFFANHNIAFQVVDMLTPVLKDIFTDSKIAQGIQLHRKKCTSIINNVIAPIEIEETVQIIRKCPFSVLIDESTDICTQKFLCVLVHYVHPEHGTVHTRLLELVGIDATDCSAVKMYGEFKKCLDSKQIPISNLIGVASDGANVMVGKNNSFFSHLQNDLPNLVLMQCICHSAALVASKATEKLPRSPEDLIRLVIMKSLYEFFST